MNEVCTDRSTGDLGLVSVEKLIAAKGELVLVRSKICEDNLCRLHIQNRSLGSVLRIMKKATDEIVLFSLENQEESMIRSQVQVWPFSSVLRNMRKV